MIERRTASPEETEAAGAALAPVLRSADVVLLVGGLGSGKTTFVRGIARGLGFEGDVTSPTFTLSHSYEGRLPILHADLWRLERLAEIEQLALDEDLEAVVLVEWGEAAEAIFPDALLVTLTVLDDTGRLIAIDARAREWAARAEDLERAVAG